MLDIYKTLCEKNNDKKGGEYSVDRWNAIYFRYICDEEKSIDDIAAENSCGKSKVYNDIDDAARTLTTLMFGIDGLKLRRWFPVEKLRTTSVIKCDNMLV